MRTVYKLLTLLLVLVFVFAAFTPKFGNVSAAEQVGSAPVYAREADAAFDFLGSVGTVYNLYCAVKGVVGTSCETDRQFWVTSLAQEGIELITRVLCESTFDGTQVDYECRSVEAYFPGGSIFGSSESDMAMLKAGRLPGGAATLIGGAYAGLVKEPPVPTNFALFFKDASRDTLFGTPAYAAGPVMDSFEGYVLEAWKITRNIALSLFGLAVGIIALMVMFRHKIAPQVTVTIYNALPMIPVVLALIVLSYPIMAIVLGFIPRLVALAASIGWEILRPSIDTIFPNPTDFVREIVDKGGFTWYTIIQMINIPFRMFADIGASALSILFGMMAVVIVVFLTLVFGLINIIKVFVSLIINTIIAPLVMLLAVLPGRQGLIVNFAKKVLADVITIPLIVLGILVGGSIILYTPLPAQGLFTLVGYSMFLVKAMLYALGIGLIWKSFGIRKRLDNILGIQDVWGMPEPQKGPRK